ncbi:uncharacterized protein ISCGN_020939 [Ixodes scapularis]
MFRRVVHAPSLLTSLFLPLARLRWNRDRSCPSPWSRTVLKVGRELLFQPVNAVWAGPNFQVAVALIFPTLPPGWHDWQSSKDGSFSLGYVMLCTE